MQELINLTSVPNSPVLKSEVLRQDKESPDTLMTSGDVSINLMDPVDIKEATMIVDTTEDDESDENERFHGGIPLTEAQKMAAQGFPKHVDLEYDLWKIWAVAKTTQDMDGSQKSSINYDADLEKMTAAESANWRRQLLATMEEDRIEYVPPTLESLKEYAENQAMFDNPKCQRQDLQEACTLLGIRWCGV